MRQSDLDPEDARAIGIAFMEALPESASWSESPVECYIQALNAAHDLRSELRGHALQPVLDWNTENDEPTLKGWRCTICEEESDIRSGFPHDDGCVLYEPSGVAKT